MTPSVRKTYPNKPSKAKLWSQGALPYLGPLPPVNHITLSWSPLTFYDITSSVPINSALLNLIADTVSIPHMLLQLSEKLEPTKPPRHLTPLVEHVLTVAGDNDALNVITGSLLRKSKRCVLVAFSSAGPPTQFLESVQNQEDAVMEQVCHKASPRLNSAKNFPNFNGVQAICLETYADQAMLSFKTHFRRARNNQMPDMFDPSFFDGSKRIFGGVPRTDAYGNPFRDTPPKLGNDMLPCEPSVVLCNSIVYSVASVGCFAIPKILRRKGDDGKMNISVGGVQVAEILVLVTPDTDQLTIISATPRDDVNTFFEFNLKRLFTKQLPFHTHPTCVALVPHTGGELPTNQMSCKRQQVNSPQVNSSQVKMKEKKAPRYTVNTDLSVKQQAEAVLHDQITLCDWNRCRERCILVASEIAFEEHRFSHKDEVQQGDDERFQNILELCRDIPMINSSVQFVIGTMTGTVIIFLLTISIKPVHEQGSHNSPITTVLVTPVMSIPLYAHPITCISPCVPFLDCNAQPSFIYVSGGYFSLIEKRIQYVIEKCTEVTEDAIKKLRGIKIPRSKNTDGTKNMQTNTNAIRGQDVNEMKKLHYELEKCLCNLKESEVHSDGKPFFWSSQNALQRKNEVCGLTRRHPNNPGMTPRCTCSCHAFVETSNEKVVFNSSERVEPCFKCLCNSHDIGFAALEAASLLYRHSGKDVSSQTTIINDSANNPNCDSAAVAVTISVPRRQHMVAVFANGIQGDITFFDICNPWSNTQYRGTHRIEIPPVSVCASSMAPSLTILADTKSKKTYLGHFSRDNLACCDDAIGVEKSVFRQDYGPYINKHIIRDSGQHMPYKRWGIHMICPTTVLGRCGIGNRVSEHAVIGYLDKESYDPNPLSISSSKKTVKKSECGKKRSRILSETSSPEGVESSTPVEIKTEDTMDLLLENDSKHSCKTHSGIVITLSEAISKLYRNHSLLLPQNSPILRSSSKCSLVCEMLGLEPNTQIRIAESEIKPLSWMIRWWVNLELQEGDDTSFTSKLSEAIGRYLHKVIESFAMLSNPLPCLQQLHQLPRSHLGLSILNSGNNPDNKRDFHVVPCANIKSVQLLRIYAAFDECLRGPDNNGDWFIPESFLVVNRREMLVISWGV